MGRAASTAVYLVRDAQVANLEAWIKILKKNQTLKQKWKFLGKIKLGSVNENSTEKSNLGASPRWIENGGKFLDKWKISKTSLHSSHCG